MNSIENDHSEEEYVKKYRFETLNRKFQFLGKCPRQFEWEYDESYLLKKKTYDAIFNPSHALKLAQDP